MSEKVGIAVKANVPVRAYVKDGLSLSGPA